MIETMIARNMYLMCKLKNPHLFHYTEKKGEYGDSNARQVSTLVKQ